MFDLNAIVSAALNAAVNARITEVLQQHADIVGGLAERIAALEKNEEYLTNRIAALENNPAQGVDTQAPSVLATQYTPVSNDQIKAALQEWATKDALVEHLDNQEWFWEKLQNRIDSTVEAGLDDHCSNYDHDDYDNHIGDDDKHFDGDIEDAVRDALSNMTFDVSIR